MKEIISLLSSGLCKRCQEQMDIRLTITGALKEYLVEKYSDHKMGARPLKRAIQSVIEDSLAEEILMKKVQPGDTVSAGFKNGKVTFTVKERDISPLKFIRCSFSDFNGDMVKTERWAKED